MITQLSGLIRTLRIRQWAKNGFIFVPLLFDGKLFNLSYLSATFVGYVLLCLLTGSVYLMNDLVDIEADRAHPTKRTRPLASGQLRKDIAVASVILIPLIILPLSAFVLHEVAFTFILLTYLALQVLYSFVFKKLVLVDVLAIATGFVLRVAAGVELVNVVRFSPWLYLFTTMLALFMGFGKRRQELVLMQESAQNHRAILQQYTIELTDQLIVIVTAATVMTYSLYTFSAEGLPENHTMMLTIPFVLYGLFRYLYLIKVREEGGAPEEVLLRDRPLQVAVFGWGLAVVLVLYVLKNDACFGICPG